MALLDDDELDIDDLPVVQRSDTNQPLFDDPEPTYKGKEKKDKKLRAEDKRGSIRTWGKSKDSTLEKTPKKSKHNRNKSGSRTPPAPDSPKADEFKKLPKGGVPPTQPSPNVKANRKSYSQLDDISDIEHNNQEEGFTVFNQPAFDREEPGPVQSTNPWASNMDDSPSSPSLSFFTDAPPSHLNTSLQDPWQASPNRKTAVQFPVDFQAVSPSRGSVPLIGTQHPIVSAERPVGRVSLPLVSTQPPAQRAFPSPVIESRTLTSHQPVTALPPPPQPLAPPPSQLPLTTTQPSSSTTTQAPSSTTIQPLPDPDWSISNELQEKCVGQFKELSSSGGLLQGDKAREFFVQSKLPNQELSAIWRLADVDRDNALSEYEFCVAMKLVMMRRKGYEIPSTLPQPLVSTLLPRTFSDNFGSQARSSSPLVSGDSPVNVELGEDSLTSQEGSQTAVLVDLGSDTGESEEGNEDTALVNSHRRTGSEGSIPKKPSRPAPPVPKIQRSKTVKNQSTDKGVERSSPTVETEGILISIDQGTPQTLRKPNKKKDYTPLDSADSTSTDHDLPRDDSTDGGFDWKQLDNRKSPAELEPSETGRGRRGHSRGRSLDLTKVIQGDSSMEVLEDLPSAVPPKPPPRPHQSPPLEQSRPSESQKEEEGGDKKTGRVRSLSTGSINKPMSPEQHTHEVELETNSLIKQKPKSVQKVRNPPRRPPPPAKPKPVEKEKSQVGAKADLREYQVPGSGVKDKRELQLRIRSLKDENAALTDLNKTLEAQLFKLMEERVKLEKRLELIG